MHNSLNTTQQRPNFFMWIWLFILYISAMVQYWFVRSILNVFVCDVFKLSAKFKRIISLSFHIFFSSVLLLSFSFGVRFPFYIDLIFFFLLFFLFFFSVTDFILFFASFHFALHIFFVFCYFFDFFSFLFIWSEYERKEFKRADGQLHAI